MKAVTIASVKNENSLVDVQTSKLVDGQVLIKIHAVGVNHVDLLWADQKVKSDDTIPGLEVAGEIVESKSTDYHKGQRVMTLLDNGGYAEYVAVNQERIMLVPDNIDYDVAATIPESYLTAYQTLFTIGNLKDNQSVLIHAGASGVGTAAIQLVKKLTNAQVITTSSSKKTAICLNYGADVAIDYTSQDFVEEVRKTTDNRGVDLIIDFIGASYYQQNIASLAFEGKLVLVGNLGGSIVENMNIMDVIGKRVSVEGTLLSTRSNQYKADLISAFSKDVLPLLNDNQIDLKVGNHFKLSETRDALACMRNKENIGKIILTVD